VHKHEGAKEGRRKDHVALVLVMSVLVKSDIARVKATRSIALTFEEYCRHGCNAA
jgi:hypothetical protein